MTLRIAFAINVAASGQRKLCSSLLLLSAFIAATLLYNHKISFHAAVMKRPASKLNKAIQQVNKK